MQVRGRRCNAHTASIDDTIAVAIRVGRGAQPEEIAPELGMSLDQLYEHLRRIVAALPEGRHQWGDVDELRAALQTQPRS